MSQMTPTAGPLTVVLVHGAFADASSWNGVVERLQAAGFAYYRPVAPNNTAENRARNRRVDVIILKTDEHLRIESRQEALAFLERSDTDGVMVTVPEVEPGDSQDGRIEQAGDIDNLADEDETEGNHQDVVSEENAETD